MRAGVVVVVMVAVLGLVSAVPGDVTTVLGVVSAVPLGAIS